MTLYDELGKILKIKRKGDESFDDFTARTTKKINALKDPDWGELTEELQIWHNETAKAREKGGDIDEADLPVLEGWPGDEPVEEEAAGDEEAAEADEGEEPGNEETANDNAEEDVDAAAESEQEGDNEAAEAAASAKQSAKKKATKAPAKKPAVAAKPEKSVKSTPKAKEKETMPTKNPVTKKTVAKKAATASARTRIGDTDTIKLLAKTNPYREGTLGAKVFAKYKDGMKVKAFADGVAKLDTSRAAVALLRYDIAKGYVKVQSAA